MQRLNRIDPSAEAANRRLTMALALSLVVHAMLLWAAPFRGNDSNSLDFAAGLVLPRFSTLSATLVATVSTPDTDPHTRLRDGRSKVVNRVDAPDSRFYAAAELDVLPTPRTPIRMPRDLVGFRKVRLLAHIDASGRVVGFAGEESDGNRQQNRAALEAVRATSFNAALRNGRPVRSQVMIELAGASGG